MVLPRSQRQIAHAFLGKRGIMRLAELREAGVRVSVFPPPS